MNIDIKMLVPKALLAGVFIGIANLTNLYCENKVIGAFLFAIGLLAVVKMGLYLYTGKVGYLDLTKSKEYGQILAIYLLNIIGVYLVSLYTQQIFGTEIWVAKQETFVKDFNWITYGFQAFFTGMLMYLAVESKDNIVIIMSVMAFILLDGKHSIAVSFWLPIWQYPVMSLLFMVGNGVGGKVLNLVQNKPKVYYPKNKK